MGGCALMAGSLVLVCASLQGSAPGHLSLWGPLACHQMLCMHAIAKRRQQSRVAGSRSRRGIAYRRARAASALSQARGSWPQMPSAPWASGGILPWGMLPAQPLPRKAASLERTVNTGKALCCDNCYYTTLSRVSLNHLCDRFRTLS